jgi:hypothetical protein
MSADLFAVTATDVNRAAVSGFTVTVVDPGSMLKQPFAIVKSETSGAGNLYQIFDLQNLDLVEITVDHPQYAQRKIQVTRDKNTGNLSTNTRSTYCGLYTPSTFTSSMMPTVEVVLVRVLRAPIKSLTSNLPVGNAEKVFDDPAGVWANPSRLIVGLTDASVSDFPVVVDPVLSKDETQNDWSRFNSTKKSVNPKDSTGGTWFEWLEYGDASGLKWLIAIWVIGRAGAKPNPNTTDVTVLYSPSTAIPFYSPKDIYPYKRKFVLNKLLNKFILLQPYTDLAYRYLSPGDTSGSKGKDFGMAYQAMAAGRSLVLIMPIQKFGFWGPIQAQNGLARMVTEVLTYVGDNTQFATPAASSFGQNQAPQLGRIALAGYSAGMNDIRLLLKTTTYQKLADTYAALASRAKDPDRTNYSDMAQQLRALPEALWAAPEGLIEKSCKELYSIDGFFQGDNKNFQDEMGDWFNRTADANLRIYATDVRFKETEVIAGTKLDDVFKGVKAQVLGKAPLLSKEFHRDDKRASFAWFTEGFMKFTGVDFMPDSIDPSIDAHHTIPRVVFSHAIALSGFSKP